MILHVSTQALDAFAKWALQKQGFLPDSGDAPDIMMMTEYSGGEMRRKLVFQDRDHAASFPRLLAHRTPAFPGSGSYSGRRLTLRSPDTRQLNQPGTCARDSRVPETPDRRCFGAAHPQVSG